MLQVLLLTLGLTVLVAALVFALIGIKMIFKRKAEFVGTCASNNPYLRERGITSCPACGSDGSTCKRETREVQEKVQPYDPLDHQ
ncbi:MAG: hypothetical protein GXO48_03950 [Chlorobi bacterium]|nr:hypothetical protein [Chlorobiota bacterium]